MERQVRRDMGFPQNEDYDSCSDYDDDEEDDEDAEYDRNVSASFVTFHTLVLTFPPDMLPLSWRNHDNRPRHG